RLLLVHEYQADLIQRNHTEDYGRFLISQSLLHNAPSISHAFSRSPLKNRIMMLKKQPAGMARIKAVIALPFVAAAVLFFSNCRQQGQPSLNTHSLEVFRNGKTAMYKGNELDMKL